MEKKRGKIFESAFEHVMMINKFSFGQAFNILYVLG